MCFVQKGHFVDVSQKIITILKKILLRTCRQEKRILEGEEEKKLLKNEIPEKIFVLHIIIRRFCSEKKWSLIYQFYLL